MAGLGKGLILLGILLVAVGLFLTLGPKFSGIPWLGHLPGDIYIERGRFTFYFPLATCLVISVVLTLVLYLFRR